MLNEPRFTHIALSVDDLIASIEWYERYTPLRVVDHGDPATGIAWLCHPEPTDHPFIVVLTSIDSTDSEADGVPLGRLGSVAHLGIELPSRIAVDAMAVLGRADGCLASTETTVAIPIGYACALNDPDGNYVEFSFNERGVYAAVKEWFEERAGAREFGTSISD